jgi:hypothetical protein
MKKIDSITRREVNGGTLVMLEIAGYIYAKWYAENPSDQQVRRDYKLYGARSKRKWKGEFRAYNQSTGQFLC